MMFNVKICFLFAEEEKRDKQANCPQEGSNEHGPFTAEATVDKGEWRTSSDASSPVNLKGHDIICGWAGCQRRDTAVSKLKVWC